MFVSNGMDAPTRTGIRVPHWKCHQPLELKGASTMKITTVGIDLAKNVFQVRPTKSVRQKPRKGAQEADTDVDLSTSE